MNIFRLFGEIAIRNDEAIQAMDETTARAEDTGQRTSSAFDGIGRAALGFGKLVVGAGVALGGAWVAAIESTREFRTHLAMLDTAFQMSGHSSEVARQTYSDLNAVLGDSGQATEAAQQLAKIADNETELATLTTTLTGVYATFGESLPIEGLAEGINHSAKLGEVQGSLADALEWSGITVEEFNARLAKCSTEQERQDLIVKTLNDTYSKAGEQYQKTNADVLAANRAQEKLTAAFAELGRIGEPILTAIKTKVADMVTAAVPHLENLVNKVKDVKKWVKDNQTTINNWKAAIAGATVSIASFVLILKWGAIMSAAKKAITGVRAAVLLFNAALRANPVGLVISLIAGLVTAFVLLWRNNEEFRAFWINLWNKIRSVCSSVISSVKSKFNDFKSAFNTVKTVFGNIQKTISDKMNSARDKVRDAIAKIKGFFNFKWSLPKLKMPSFSLKGKFSLDPPSVPKLSVRWNKTGAIFASPTIFNTRLGLQGVGDGGEPEAVAPISKLTGYVREAVRAESNNELLGRIIIEQTQLLMDFLRRSMPHDVLLNGNALVGELLPAVDAGLSDRYIHAQRGNVR